VSAFALLAASMPGAAGDKQQAKDIYQDFRNRRPLHAELRLAGAPDVDDVAKAEEGGLRITLPPAREQHWPIEVQAIFSLTGDFEITGTYELLSAVRPAKGYGVGVALNIASNVARDKFAKISRLMRAKEGSVHLAEYWTNIAPKAYLAPSMPTEAKAGQLRLVRKGARLHYLVSDAPGQEFRDVFDQPDFGTEDMIQLNFGVSDSGAPGNPVDARLIDLRIRTGKSVGEQASAPAPLPELEVILPAAPGNVLAVAEPDGKATPRVWLVAAMLVVAVLTILLLITLGTALFLRNRGTGAKNTSRSAFTPGANPFT
jgi:hypothetical protein